LPIPYDASNQGKFNDFFKEWGTHYLTHGIYGGTYNMSTVLSESDTLTISSTKLKTAVEAGFSDGADSFKGKAAFESATRKELGTTDESTAVTIYAIGGDSDASDLTWAMSIAGVPTLLYDVLAIDTDEIRPAFEPIWKLVSGDLQDTLTKALLTYLPQDAVDLPSVFGSVDKKGMNQKYVADSDGFCLMSLAGYQSDIAKLSARVRADEADDSAVLNEVLAMAVQNQDTDRWITHTSLFCPVSQGNWVSQTCDAPADDKTQASGFMSTTLRLGTCEPVQIGPGGGGFSARPDGFFIVRLSVGPDAEYRMGQLRLLLNGQCVAAASVATIGDFHGSQGESNPLQASFCIPIPKGSSAECLVPVNQDCAIDGTWLPLLESSATFGPIVEQKALTLDTGSPRSVTFDFPSSMQDQFIFGYIEAPQDGARGTLSLIPQTMGDAAPPVYAAASCHVYHGSSAQIPFETVTMAVRRGQTWTATLNDTRGLGLAATLYSISLTPK
jgi:hypothetical protein